MSGICSLFTAILYSSVRDARLSEGNQEREFNKHTERWENKVHKRNNVYWL